MRIIRIEYDDHKPMDLTEKIEELEEAEREDE